MIVSIYGHTGVVGAQLYRWLKEQGVDVRGVSLDRRDGEPGGEWAFLCLPTPTIDGVQDRNALDEVMATVTAQNVVIRSTVLPGTCAAYQAQYPEKNIYHWPEFLSARTAWNDFCYQRIRIVGIQGRSAQQLWRAVWDDVLPETDTMYQDTRTAEAIKYAHNAHGAMQVIFGNLLRDMCDKGGADMRALQATMTWLGYISAEVVDAYWDTERDGYRGYGGACFPKDVAALATWMRGQAELLEGMEAANARLRGVQ